LTQLSPNEKAVLFLLYTLTGANPHKSSPIVNIEEHLIQDVREGLDSVEFVRDMLMKLERARLARVDPRSPTEYQITKAGIDEISRVLTNLGRT
jgi:hypothetical protein